LNEIKEKSFVLPCFFENKTKLVLLEGIILKISGKINKAGKLYLQIISINNGYMWEQRTPTAKRQWGG
jgi:hypothetical protein